MQRNSALLLRGPVMDMFWGDLCGTVVDPDGYTSMVGTRKAEPLGKEMKRGMMKQQPGVLLPLPDELQSNSAGCAPLCSGSRKLLRPTPTIRSLWCARRSESVSRCVRPSAHYLSVEGRGICTLLPLLPAKVRSVIGSFTHVASTMHEGVPRVCRIDTSNFQQGTRDRRDSATGFPVRSHHLSRSRTRAAVRGELLHRGIFSTL